MVSELPGIVSHEYVYHPCAAMDVRKVGTLL